MKLNVTVVEHQLRCLEMTLCARHIIHTHVLGNLLQQITAQVRYKRDSAKAFVQRFCKNQTPACHSQLERVDRMCWLGLWF